MNTDLDHGDWHSGPQSYSFTATVVFFSLAQIAGVITLLHLL